MSSSNSTAAVALRLHLNENTAGCSPAVLAAVRSLTAEELAWYPDYDAVTTACERWFGVPPGWVQLTNGLDEGLQIVAQLARRVHDERDPRANQPGEVIIVEPAFEMYELLANAAGLTCAFIPPAPNFRFPAEAVLARVGDATRLIYLNDPHNPTGQAIPSDAIDAIATAAAGALVLVDEAYAEFTDAPTTSGWRTTIGPALERHRNLIAGRTFAKAYGLAGLRVGALVAHPETLRPLRAIQPPFTVNAAAVRGLDAALRDRAYLDNYVAAAHESRELIYVWCRQRNIEHWPSDGNFVLIRLGHRASAVARAMAERGIRIRDRSTAPGCAGCVRITAGIVEHTRTCLSVLEDVLASRIG
jgi:histidinol-phosphate aminotransferase